MPETMDERISRREYLKYAAAGLVAVTGAAAGYYYFCTKPSKPTVTPTLAVTQTHTPEPTPTVTTITLTPTTTPTTTIERTSVEKYAMKKGVYETIDKRILRELSKLPDYQELDGDTKSLDFMFDLALDEENKPHFYQMFTERLEMKKLEYQSEPYPYCSQLEAVDWIGRDSQSTAERFVKNYRKGGFNDLINYAWKKTSVSDDYKSEKWIASDNQFKKYEEVKNRLNLDLLLKIYMRDNIDYDYFFVEGHQHYWQFPYETFVRKKGICADQAAFAVDCLRNSGHNSLVLSILWQEKSETKGHSICVNKTPSSRYWTFDNTLKMSRLDVIEGPFQKLRRNEPGRGDSVEEYLVERLNPPRYGYSIALYDQYFNYVSSF
jgi:hypothetical protein